MKKLTILFLSLLFIHGCMSNTPTPTTTSTTNDNNKTKAIQSKTTSQKTAKNKTADNTSNHANHTTSHRILAAGSHVSGAIMGS